MKNLFKGFVFFTCIGLLQSASAVVGDLNLTATSLKLKVYKFAVSTSPLCTNLVTIVDNGSTPTEVDFLQNPNLGSGIVADGTYPCVVIEFADVLKFTPQDSASGNCSSAVEETLDVCRSENGSTSKLIDGTTTTCGVQGTSDRVAMYITTGSAGAGNSDVFNPPTSIGDATHGLNLGTALSISGTSSGKFVVNPAGQVCDDFTAGCEGGPGGGNSCQMGPPTFNFVKL